MIGRNSIAKKRQAVYSLFKKQGIEVIGAVNSLGKGKEASMARAYGIPTILLRGKTGKLYRVGIPVINGKAADGSGNKGGYVLPPVSLSEQKIVPCLEEEAEEQ